MSKRHQSVASGKKTRTGQARKARHIAKRGLSDYCKIVRRVRGGDLALPGSAKFS